ncbi:hypothetical protein [Arenibaculum sp.]|jgi:hypothetical protein|uniref:hypothetical protein n=1 Tax=Arenibaculum sp. TaxID=2865862 RepID=UPI002E0EF79A|nr:hypothetical protein [Arenibaculum sp.]
MCRTSLAFLVFLLTGCSAEQARMPLMVAQAPTIPGEPASYRGAISVEPVEVRALAPPWGSEISPRILKEALTNSLAVRGLFVYGEPSYRLFATVEDVQQKLDELILGLDITVFIEMNYRLIESDTGAEIINETIITSSKQPFRYLSAAERTQAATEEAIKENIESILKKLVRSEPNSEDRDIVVAGPE